VARRTRCASIVPGLRHQLRHAGGLGLARRFERGGLFGDGFHGSGALSRRHNGKVRNAGHGTIERGRRASRGVPEVEGFDLLNRGARVGGNRHEGEFEHFGLEEAQARAGLHPLDAVVEHAEPDRDARDEARFE